MKMKILANLFIFISMILIVVGVCTKFFDMVILFPSVKPLSYILVANTCLLIALILKLAND